MREKWTIPGQPDRLRRKLAGAVHMEQRGFHFAYTRVEIGGVIRAGEI